MPGILSPILRPLRRLAGPGRPPGPPPKPAAPAPSPGRYARRLADAIDRAIAAGQWEHAKHLAVTAATLTPGYPRLSEALARLRLAQGDPETAVRLIETCPRPPASLRLLRAACLLLCGARSEAQRDLYRWSDRASAPLDARLLLGLLEARTDGAAAIRTLRRNLRHLEDPRTLQALLLITLLHDRREQALAWAHRLRAASHPAASDDAPAADLMLRSLGMPGVGDDVAPTTEQVGALAMELITYEPAIEALTEAQRRRPHAPTIRLLRRALQQALTDLDDAAGAMLALARLSLLAGDVAAARVWVEQGLERNPMSVELTMLRDELAGPTPPDPGAILARPGERERRKEAA